MELRWYLLCFLSVYATVCVGDVAQERNHPAVRAFLDVIACLEGTYDAGYNIKFGGKRFSQYTDHPREEIHVTVRGTSLTSTAAGRYQLKADEWDAVRGEINAPSFGPLQQDYAMVYILMTSETLAYVKALQFYNALAQLAPYKESVSRLLSGTTRRYSQRSLYATFIARYRYYRKKNSQDIPDVLDTYLAKPEVRAFLDMLAFAEGTNRRDGYAICFTGKKCDLRQHPGVVIGARSGDRNLYSSAAGRYQFLKDAWQIVAWRIAASDFSAYHQDRAAVQILLDMRVIDALLRDDLQTAVQRANGKWASLPGAQYHQPTHKFEDVARVFYERRKYYRNN